MNPLYELSKWIEENKKADYYDDFAIDYDDLKAEILRLNALCLYNPPMKIGNTTNDGYGKPLPLTIKQ